MLFRSNATIPTMRMMPNIARSTPSPIFSPEESTGPELEAPAVPDEDDDEVPVVADGFCREWLARPCEVDDDIDEEELVTATKSLKSLALPVT